MAKGGFLYRLLFLFLSFIIQFFNPFLLNGAEKKNLNVLLITIDTLRADRLSCYGSEHLITPNIDKLAEKGVLFSKAFAHTTTTLPSHTNILCGTTPLYHGVHDNLNFILSKKFLTLAEHLKKIGYKTGAFIGGFPLDSKFGLDQGFDTYDDDFGKKSELMLPAEFVVNKAETWLGHQKNPWFLWLHCYDPHDPYTPPAPFKKKYEKAPYDGEVAYVDSVLGKLFSYLDKNNLFENTIIVFTGDHGEGLGQHGEMTHGFFAYNEIIWIPMIIYSPGVSKDQIDQYVSHIDIFPTVCDLLEIEKPAFLQGISLLPAIEGKKIIPRKIYFESLYPYYSRGWAPLQGFISSQEKYIDSPIHEIYDMEHDFNELNNLAPGKNLDTYHMKLDQIYEDQSNLEGQAPKKKIDPEILRKLASLGYVSNLNLTVKEDFGPDYDIKILLPFYNKANWASINYKNGKISFDSAMHSLKEVLTSTEKIDIAYKGLASLYKESGSLKAAIEVLEVGVEHHPSSYEIIRDLVFYLSEAGQFQDVITLCKDIQIVQMDFEIDIWNVLGYAYLRTGDLEKAKETYIKAVSIDDEDSTVLGNFGKVHLSIFQKTNDLYSHKKALEFLKKAVEIDPANASAFDSLGIAYLLAGDLDNAIFYWEKVFKLSPSRASPVYNLARAHFAKGNYPKVLDLLQQYLKKYSNIISPGNKKMFNELIQKCKK